MDKIKKSLFQVIMLIIPAVIICSSCSWTIDFLKKQPAERMLVYAKAQTESTTDNTFDTFVEQFRSGYENTLVKEVVEDTKETFELKISECLWASTFQEVNMGDYGYALVCWADYALVKGFNPNIKLVRDKTLMQDHDCCKHKYIFED